MSEPQPISSSTDISDVELAGYLDELLPAQRAVAIESQLRESAALRQRVTALIHRRDQGGHTIGEIWRRQRLSCPTRSDLGSYVLGVLDAAYADYVRFHVHTVGCRFCEANLMDLEQTQKKSDASAEPRRKRFFESSAGQLVNRR